MLLLLMLLLVLSLVLTRLFWRSQVVNAVLTELAERKRFDAEKFKENHPGGAIGASL